MSIEWPAHGLKLQARIESGDATIGIIGMGYGKSVAWDEEAITGYDAVLIATDHDAVDYAGLANAARLVVDTRNACGKAGVTAPNIVRA